MISLVDSNFRAELLLKSRENRGSRLGRPIGGHSRRRHLRRPFQIEIEETSETRSIDDATTPRISSAGAGQ